MPHESKGSQSVRLVPEGTPVCFGCKHSVDFILIYIFMLILQIYIYINSCCASFITVMNHSFQMSVWFKYPDFLWPKSDDSLLCMHCDEMESKSSPGHLMIENIIQKLFGYSRKKSFRVYFDSVKFGNVCF